MGRPRKGLTFSSISSHSRLTWLLEMPSMPMARTRSSTERVAMNVGLLHDRRDGLLGQPARLEKAREVAALAQLRDAQLNRASPLLQKVLKGHSFVGHRRFLGCVEFATRPYRRIDDDRRKPLARYGAMGSALRERLAPAELHHKLGHGPEPSARVFSKGMSGMIMGGCDLSPQG